jgi:glycosyltransferase involved in cell wall biosynthesis
MPENLLLISYTFPPYPGIGGRRWAKFAKYLSKLGYQVHVVHAKNPFKEESLWLADVRKEPNIHTYELAPLYPKVLLTQPKTIAEKLNYRLSLLKVKLFSKGTPYDRGIFWKQPMLRLSRQLIEKHHISNIVVSCAPFSCAYYALELKKENKDLNLIIDLRDPWTWGKGYGYAGLASQRLKHEQMMEKAVVEQADMIFVPVDVMQRHLKSVYKEHSNKIALLPHGFDKEEIKPKTSTSSASIRIVFYGSLYEGIGEYFNVISDAIKNSKNVVLDIYSDSERYSAVFERNGLLKKTVFYHKSIPSDELFNELKTATYVLVIHPDYGVDNISTKFYEIIYSRTPILYVSKPGTTSKFVEDNRVGYFLELDSLESKLKSIFENKELYPYNNTYDNNGNSFDSLAESLIINYFKNDTKR